MRILFNCHVRDQTRMRVNEGFITEIWMRVGFLQILRVWSLERWPESFILKCFSKHTRLSPKLWQLRMRVGGQTRVRERSSIFVLISPWPNVGLVSSKKPAAHFVTFEAKGNKSGSRRGGTCD